MLRIVTELQADEWSMATGFLVEAIGSLPVKSQLSELTRLLTMVTSLPRPQCVSAMADVVQRIYLLDMNIWNDAYLRTLCNAKSLSRADQPSALTALIRQIGDPHIRSAHHVLLEHIWNSLCWLAPDTDITEPLRALVAELNKLPQIRRQHVLGLFIQREDSRIPAGYRLALGEMLGMPLPDSRTSP
jgi:hypothetical protein